MKEGGRSVSTGRDRLRRTLIVVEFALALTLLAGGGMAVHALLRTINADLGFVAERQITFELPVPRTRLSTDGEIKAFYRTLLERTQALPGVASVAVSTGMPVEGASFGTGFEIVGRPVTVRGSGVNMVTPGYYRTFGIATVRGRPLDRDNRAGSTRVVIVNQAFVRRYLADVDPIGQRVIFAPFVCGAGPRPDPVPGRSSGSTPTLPTTGPDATRSRKSRCRSGRSLAAGDARGEHDRRGVRGDRQRQRQ